MQNQPTIEEIRAALESITQGMWYVHNGYILAVRDGTTKPVVAVAGAGRNADFIANARAHSADDGLAKTRRCNHDKL